MPVALLRILTICLEDTLSSIEDTLSSLGFMGLGQTPNFPPKELPELLETKFHSPAISPLKLRKESEPGFEPPTS